MKGIFTTIYETWLGIFNPDYDLIFSNFFDDNGYVKLGLTFIFIPLILWSLFYFLWKYPYGRFWHWLLWLGIIFVVVYGVTYWFAWNEIFFSNNQPLNDALADPTTRYQYYAADLPARYALSNGVISIFVGLIYSFIMKRFSKIQIHLPF